MVSFCHHRRPGVLISCSMPSPVMRSSRSTRDRRRALSGHRGHPVSHGLVDADTAQYGQIVEACRGSASRSRCGWPGRRPASISISNARSGAESWYRYLARTSIRDDVRVPWLWASCHTSPTADSLTIAELTDPPGTDCTWNSSSPARFGGIDGDRLRHRRGHTVDLHPDTDPPQSGESRESRRTTARSRVIRYFSTTWHSTVRGAWRHLRQHASRRSPASSPCPSARSVSCPTGSAESGNSPIRLGTSGRSAR